MCSYNLFINVGNKNLTKFIGRYWTAKIHQTIYHVCIYLNILQGIQITLDLIPFNLMKIGSKLDDKLLTGP